MEKLPAAAAVAKQAERKPSSEQRYLTLSHEQLNSLREAALEVINNHTKEEAEKIFLAGLEPVTATPKATSARKVLGKRTRH